MFGSSSMTRIFAAMLPASYPVIRPFGTTYITYFCPLWPPREKRYREVSQEVAQARASAFVRAPGHQVIETPRGQRKPRLAPERADRRHGIAEAPRAEPGRNGDDLFGERKRDHLLLVA